MDKQIELIERHLDVTRVGCKFSRVKSIERQSFHGRAARVIASGKLGHASTTDGLTNNQLIEKARDTARVKAPDNLSFPTHAITSDRLGSEVKGLTESDLRDWARQMVGSMRQHNPHLAIELEARRVTETVDLRNTNGGEAHLSRAWLEAETWVERHTEGEVLVALDRFAAAQVDDSHLDFARRMARRFRWASKPIRPVTGPQPVIFSPGAFASLLEPLLYACNGSFVFNSQLRASKRRSGLAAKLGRQMFDPKFSLYDDATLPGRPHSTLVDHEGSPGQCTPLILNGVVTGLYHNLISAAQAEAKSTGNGWRDLLDPPAAMPTNVHVACGGVRLAEMLKSLNDGLLVDLIGAGDGSPGLTGDFSRTIVLAYQIKCGRVIGYVRGASVGGDLYHSLQNIEALSCDGYWSDNIFAPYIQLGGVTISA